MSDFTLTVILATFIMLLCLAGLGIGQLITGKSKLRGSCGGIKKFNDNLGLSSDCAVCGKKASDKECLNSEKNKEPPAS